MLLTHYMFGQVHELKDRLPSSRSEDKNDLYTIWVEKFMCSKLEQNWDINRVQLMSNLKNPKYESIIQPPLGESVNHD